ncbi:MAG: DUF2911 domain-containing protein [Chitinophagaceae bacterium]
MKKFFTTAVAVSALLFTVACKAQEDKSKRASPPAQATQKTGDLTITIDYSQPSVKGRTIGSDLEPMDGQVWRTGANDATTFEVNKDVKVEGQALPKGKYGLFTLKNGSDWTIIFNKTWKQWGAFSYKEADDALRVTVKESKADPFAEKMTFTISDAGVVTLVWGEHKVQFTVK